MRCPTGTVLTSVKSLLGILPVALGLPEFQAIIGRRIALEKIHAASAVEGKKHRK